MSFTDDTGETNEAAFKRQLRERSLRPDLADVEAVAKKIENEIIAWFKKHGDDNAKVFRGSRNDRFNLLLDEVHGRLLNSKLIFAIKVYPFEKTGPVVIRVFLNDVIDGPAPINPDKIFLEPTLRSLPRLLYFWGNEVYVSHLLRAIDNRVDEALEHNRKKTASAIHHDRTGESSDEALRRQMKERSLHPDHDEANAVVDRLVGEIKAWFKKRESTAQHADRAKNISSLAAGAKVSGWVGDFYLKLAVIIYNAKDDDPAGIIMYLDHAKNRDGSYTSAVSTGVFTYFWGNEPTINEMLAEIDDQIEKHEKTLKKTAAARIMKTIEEHPAVKEALVEVGGAKIIYVTGWRVPAMYSNGKVFVDRDLVHQFDRGDVQVLLHELGHAYRDKIAGPLISLSLMRDPRTGEELAEDEVVKRVEHEEAEATRWANERLMKHGLKPLPAHGSSSGHDDMIRYLLREVRKRGLKTPDEIERLFVDFAKKQRTASKKTSRIATALMLATAGRGPLVWFLPPGRNMRRWPEGYERAMIGWIRDGHKKAFETEDMSDMSDERAPRGRWVVFTDTIREATQRLEAELLGRKNVDAMLSNLREVPVTGQAR